MIIILAQRGLLGGVSSGTTTPPPTGTATPVTANGLTMTANSQPLTITINNA